MSALLAPNLTGSIFRDGFTRELLFLPLRPSLPLPSQIGTLLSPHSSLLPLIIRHSATPFFPLHTRFSPATPLFPLLTQKQGVSLVRPIRLSMQFCPRHSSLRTRHCFSKSFCCVSYANPRGTPLQKYRCLCQTNSSLPLPHVSPPKPYPKAGHIFLFPARWPLVACFLRQSRVTSHHAAEPGPRISAHWPLATGHWSSPRTNSAPRRINYNQPQNHRLHSSSDEVNFS
jgi:hypothetical protein